MRKRLYIGLVTILSIGGCTLEDGFERGYDCPPKMFAYDIDPLNPSKMLEEPYLCMLDETNMTEEGVADCVPCDFKMNRITDENYVYLKKNRGKYVYSNKDEQEENIDRKYLSNTAKDFAMYRYSEYKNYIESGVEMRLYAVEDNCTRSDMEQFEECNSLCNVTEDETKCTNECKKVISRINRCSVLGDYKNYFKFNSCPDEYPVCSFGTMDDADVDAGNNFYCSLNLISECSSASVDEDCKNRISNWKSGECDKGSCVVSECKTGYQPDVGGRTCVANCETGMHYDNKSQKCIADNVNNCGATNKLCSKIVAHWVKGKCENGVCKVTQCRTGFKPSNDSLSCASDCKVGQHYDNTAQKCVADDKDNCGATGHSCSDEIKNSKTVACSQGKCTVSKCMSGYTPNSNVCTSTCTSLQYYDSETGQCATSNLDNCGQKGFQCSNNVTNWVSGDCSGNVCIVKSCASGFTPSSDKKSCVSTCSDSQYYDLGACKTSDVNNCGQKGYQCSAHISNWSKGACTGNVCIVKECESGYSVVGKECKANCGTTKYYDDSTGTCVDSDADNCGQKKFKCSDIIGWGDGSCSNNQCVPTACTTNYHIHSNNCVADTNTECGSSRINCLELRQACINGTCQTQCPSGQVLCHGFCFTSEVLGLVHIDGTTCDCSEGWRNPDGKWSNGCEEDIPGF